MFADSAWTYASSQHYETTDEGCTPKLGDDRCNGGGGGQHRELYIPVMDAAFWNAEPQRQESPDRSGPTSATVLARLTAVDGSGTFTGIREKGSWRTCQNGL